MKIKLFNLQSYLHKLISQNLYLITKIQTYFFIIQNNYPESDKQRSVFFPDLHGQFYENTVVVQYDKDLLEVWDEAKRLRCEWFNDYEKTASKPPMVIADLDVVQLDFRGK